MPNWCYNKVEVTGNQAELLAFANTLKRSQSGREVISKGRVAAIFMAKCLDLQVLPDLSIKTLALWSEENEPMTIDLMDKIDFLWSQADLTVFDNLSDFQDLWSVCKYDLWITSNQSFSDWLNTLIQYSKEEITDKLVLDFCNYQPQPLGSALLGFNRSSQAFLSGIFDTDHIQDLRDFRCNNWGTKWNPSDNVVYQEKNKIIIEFNSAWSPGLVVFDRLSDQYQRLRFDCIYREDNLRFCGRWLFENGLTRLDLDTEYGDEVPSWLSSDLDTLLAQEGL
jgi:hypothetical protein